MIILLAKYIVLLFGSFLMVAGLLMLFAPVKAAKIIGKAGSTNFINYAEITIRMIPAAGLIIYAEYSRSPVFFSVLGWFMLITSVILFFVPRRLHHSYSLKAATIIKPRYFQCISPFALLFGAYVLYNVF